MNLRKRSQLTLTCALLSMNLPACQTPMEDSPPIDEWGGAPSIDSPDTGASSDAPLNFSQVVEFCSYQSHQNSGGEMTHDELMAACVLELSDWVVQAGEPIEPGLPDGQGGADGGGSGGDSGGSGGSEPTIEYPSNCHEVSAPIQEVRFEAGCLWSGEGSFAASWQCWSSVYGGSRNDTWIECDDDGWGAGGSAAGGGYAGGGAPAGGGYGPGGATAAGGGYAGGGAAAGGSAAGAAPANF